MATIPYTDELNDKLESKWQRINNLNFNLQTLDKIPLNMQLDNIISICNEFDEDYRKISSEIDTNVVK